MINTIYVVCKVLKYEQSHLSLRATLNKWDHCSAITEITDEEREAQRSPDPCNLRHTWLKIRAHFYEFTLLETCWFETSGDSPVISEKGPRPRGQEETKEVGHSRLGGGRFNKQGNLLTRLALGSCRTQISPSAGKISNLYRSLNWIHSSYTN